MKFDAVCDTLVEQIRRELHEANPAVSGQIDRLLDSGDARCRGASRRSGRSDAGRTPLSP